jgi:hypothetical protein
LAVANYHDTYGSLPPAYVLGPDGRPWHSWRVLILPFLEQSEVYQAYRFDEPWDGPHNRTLVDSISTSYLRPGLDPSQKRYTSFVAVVGPETAWPGASALAREKIGDSPAHTLLAVEVADSKIPWMAPDDLPFDRMTFRVNDPTNRLPGIGSRLGGGRVVKVDGMVHTFTDGLAPQTLRALLTANGREPVDIDRLTGWR